MQKQAVKHRVKVFCQCHFFLCQYHFTRGAASTIRVVTWITSPQWSCCVLKLMGNRLDGL